MPQVALGRFCDFDTSGRVNRKPGPGAVVQGIEFTTGQTLDLVNVTGSGCLYELELIVLALSGTLLPSTVVLNIAVDGEASPSTSVPLFEAFGYGYCNSISGFAGAQFDTEFVSVEVPPNTSSGTKFRGTLAYKMPYRTSLRVWLSTSATTDWLVWCNPSWGDSLRGAWNALAKFQMVRTASTLAVPVDGGAKTITVNPTTGAILGAGTGTNFTGFDTNLREFSGDDFEGLVILSVADNTHATVDPTNAYLRTAGQAVNYTVGYGQRFLNRTSERGYILSLIAAYKPTTADFGYLEGNHQFRIDGETATSWMYSGTEDLGLGAFYWNNGVIVGARERRGVVIANDPTSTIVSFIRHWAADAPRYTSSAVGYWPQLGGADTVAATHIVALYTGI